LISGIHQEGNSGQCSHREVVLLRLGIRYCRGKDGVGHNLMKYHNQQKPHTASGGISPDAAEEKLKTVSGIS